VPAASDDSCSALMPAARHGLVRANLVLDFHSVDRSQDGGLGELRRQPGAVAAMGRPAPTAAGTPQRC